MDFRFDSETHTYYWQDREIPGVTDTLKAVGLIDDRFWKQYAWVGGKRIHAALEYLDQGDLDRDSVLERHLGYLDAYEKFKRDYSFQPGKIEAPTYHQFYLYGGTPDRSQCQLSGQAGILDIKTGQPQDWHRVQLWAYKECEVSWDAEMKGLKLWDLYLKENGKYRLISHPDDEDKIWPAVLKVYRFGYH